MKIKNTWLIATVAASLFALDRARADISIVDNNNLDTAVTNEDLFSSQTIGVKNGTGEFYGANYGQNNPAGTQIPSGDQGADAYWQGFKTGPSGNINLLTLDLTVLYSTPGVNKIVSGADTATFYLYTFPNMDITQGEQIGPAIATVTAAEIESGTPVGYTANNGSDIYQYTLINSLSSYDLAANTDYAIVMMTSSGSQDVGWAESDTEATGDMGEFDHLNHGGNNGGEFGQMELGVVPEPATAGCFLLGLGVMACFRRSRQNGC